MNIIKYIIIILVSISFQISKGQNLYVKNYLGIDHYRVRNAMSYYNIAQTSGFPIGVFAGFQFPVHYKKNTPQFSQYRIYTGFLFAQRYGKIGIINNGIVEAFATYYDIPIVLDIKSGAVLKQGYPIQLGVSLGYYISLPSNLIYFSDGVLPIEYQQSFNKKYFVGQGILTELKGIWQCMPNSEIEMGFRLKGDINFLYKAKNIQNVIIPIYVGYGNFISFTRYFGGKKHEE